MRSGSPIVLQLGEIEQGRTVQRLLYSLLSLYRPIYVLCFSMRNQLYVLNDTCYDLNNSLPRSMALQAISLRAKDICYN